MTSDRMGWGDAVSMSAREPTIEDLAISADEIEAFARQGVMRAIAARGEIIELTAEQVQTVGGAAKKEGEGGVLSGAVVRIRNPAKI